MSQVLCPRQTAGEQPSPACVHVIWFAGAVPTGRLRGCSYLAVSPFPPPIAVEDAVQTVFSQAKDAQVPS